MGERNLRVRARNKGGAPRIYVRYRRDGVELEPAVGRGWLVPEGDADAKPNGKTIRGWVDRRGRAPDGLLTVDAAWRLVPEVIAAYEEELERGEKAALRRAARAGRKTLGDAVELWLAAMQSDDPEGRWKAWKHSHQKNMGSYARRMAGELGAERFIDELTTADLRKWLSVDLRPMRNGKALTVAPTSKLRATYAGVISGLFRFACWQGWVEQDLSVGLPAYRPGRKRADDPLRREEYLTKDELAAARAELRAGDPSVRCGRSRGAPERFQDAVQILLMAMVGLRPGETIALVWQQIDFAANSIRIVDARTMGVTGTPKSGSGRPVPMPAAVLAELRRLSERGFATRPQDRVFVGRDGGHVDLVALADRFSAAQARAGICPPRQLRQMRNTFGTVCAAQGIPIRTFQQWMGHASITTTEIYTPFMPMDEHADMINKAFA